MTRKMQNLELFSNLIDACSELILLAPLLLLISLFFSGYEQELSDVLLI